MDNVTNYIGYFLKGKFHGAGCLWYPNGAKLEGEFKEGELASPGKIIYPNGCIMNGVTNLEEARALVGG